MGMSIDLWTDDTYIKRPTYRGIPPKGISKDDLEDRLTHRNIDCYTSCIAHHKRHNRTWTMLLSADEYLTYNSIASDDRDDLFYLENRIFTGEYSSPYRVRDIKNNIK